MKYSDNRNAYIYFRRALSLGLYVRAKKKAKPLGSAF